MDIQHYFTVEGSGEPLILLHGNGEDYVIELFRVVCMPVKRS